MHLMKIATKHHESGNLHQAERLYKQVLELQPSDGFIWNQASVCAWQRQQSNLALQRILKAIELDPNQACFYNNLGNIHQQQNNLSQAILAYQKAIELQYNYPQAWTNLGVAYFRQENLELAQQSHEQALILDSTHFGALFNLGECLYKKGDIHTAEIYLQQVHQQDPTDIDNLYLLSDLLLTNKTEHQQLYLFVLREDESIAQWWIRQGIYQENNADINQAKAYYQRALEYQPCNQTAQYLLGILEGKPMQRAPKAYLTELFDAYAPQFEAQLNSISYQTPQQLMSLIGEQHFSHVLDLGCGTGLMGSLLYHQAQMMTGVDVSTKMLEIAKQKKYYEHLIHNDIIDFLQHSKPRTYDLIVATDVFVYFGDLNDVFSAIQKSLCRKGRFLFSIELAMEKNWVLNQRGRYAHPTTLIEKWALKNQFKIQQTTKINMRKEYGKWVQGMGFLLENMN